MALSKFQKANGGEQAFQFMDGSGFNASGTPVMTADSLAKPPRQAKLPPPVIPTQPTQFVDKLQPAINQGQDGLIQANTREAKQRDDVLGRLLNIDDTSSQSVYDNAFSKQGGDEYLKQFTDANTKLATLQGNYRSVKQKVSSARGQSQVGEAFALGEIGRQEAVEVGNQAIVVQAMQGNVETARQIALDTSRFANEDRMAKLQSLSAQFSALDGIVTGQEKQLLDLRKEEVDRQKAELERLQKTVDAAITSGGASTEELLKLSDPSLSDADKLFVAQSIVARDAMEDQAFEQNDTTFDNNLAQQAEDRLSQGEGDSPLTAEELIKFGGLPAGTTWADVVAAGVSPEKPPTDTQRQTAGYAQRIEDAVNIFNNIEGEISKFGKTNYKIQKGLPNWAPGKNTYVQQQEQAERNFINAVLRRESGATITPDEFNNAALQYLPQPGDQAEVLANKKANRERVLGNFKNESGSAYTGNRPSLSDIEGGQVKGATYTVEKVPLLNMDGNAKTENIPLMKAYPEGSYPTGKPGQLGNQCGYFVRSIVEKQGLTYPKLGNSLSEKTAVARKYGVPVSQARPGSVLLTKESKTYGHVAYIIGKTATGFELAESNYGLDGKISYGREIPFNSPLIIGVINPQKA